MQMQTETHTQRNEVSPMGAETGKKRHPGAGSDSDDARANSLKFDVVRQTRRGGAAAEHRRDPTAAVDRPMAAAVIKLGERAGSHCEAVVDGCGGVSFVAVAFDLVRPGAPAPAAP